MDRPSVQPLSRIPAGRKVTVVALAGGHAFQNRLVSMGLNVGSTLELMHSGNGRGGPTLVAVGEVRLAIGHGMAEKVLVAVEEG